MALGDVLLSNPGPAVMTGKALSLVMLLYLKDDASRIRRIKTEIFLFMANKLLSSHLSDANIRRFTTKK